MVCYGLLWYITVYYGILKYAIVDYNILWYIWACVLHLHSRKGPAARSYKNRTQSWNPNVGAAYDKNHGSGMVYAGLEWAVRLENCSQRKALKPSPCTLPVRLSFLGQAFHLTKGLKLAEFLHLKALTCEHSETKLQGKIWGCGGPFFGVSYDKDSDILRAIFGSYLGKIGIFE